LAGDRLFAFALAFPEALMAVTNIESQTHSFISIILQQCKFSVNYDRNDNEASA